MSTFIIIGDLRFEHRVFRKIRDNSVAQIDFYADIEYDGQELKDTKVLSLEIEGDIGEQWVVDDQSPRFLPYLKPVAGYRNYFVKQLGQILTELPESSWCSPSCPLWMGINTYIKELEKFGEIRSLAGQLRSLAERVQRQVKNNSSLEESITNKLEDAIQVLGGIAVTKQPFKAI